MFDLAGFFSLSLVFIVTYSISVRYPEISKILFVALIIRILVIAIGQIISLPDTTADARSFEYHAWRIAKNGFHNLIYYFPGFRYDFYNWFIAVPYSLFGRSVLMAQSMSLIFGIGCILYSWKIAKLIWDNYTAKKVAWTVALFPSLILYSCITMREVYICFFVLVALHAVILWVRTNSLKYIFFAFLGFLFAAFFNGAMLVGALTFLAIVFLSYLKKFYISIKYNKVNLKIISVLLILIFGMFFVYEKELNLPKLGILKELNLNVLFVKTINSTRGDASFPEWTKITSADQIIYKSPIRILYFVFSPFPWDIAKIVHLIGSIDAIIYMYLVFLIFKNKKAILADPALRVIFYILLIYIFIFSFGVGNFGTSIRHRSKLAIIFILLAAPLLKKLVFSKKII